jgi:predicted DNA-binding protein
MSTRINARLERDHSRKLAYLQARTGKTTTEIVRASLDLYFEHMAASTNARALLEDFVGSGRASPDLSTDYKAALGELLEVKLGRKRGRRR